MSSSVDDAKASSTAAAAEDRDEDVILDEDEEEDESHAAATAQEDVTIINNFVVVRKFFVPPEGFDLEKLEGLLGADEIKRVKIKADNVTLVAALMMLDPKMYPSVSRARKALRKGRILVHKGPLGLDDKGQPTVFDESKCERGKVSHRVEPRYVICEQSKVGNVQKLKHYPVEKNKKPPYELPVIYEDDYFAIVNKPAGTCVNNQKELPKDEMCIRHAAAYVLTPPAYGTRDASHRPGTVHRLDKPTCGVLLIAKTKPAKVDLVKQFTARIIRKTYTAIINGIPKELEERAITSKQAHDLGVDVGYFDSRDAVDNVMWQHIDMPLVDNDKKEQTAVTVWRPVKTVDCPRAKDGKLTLVELKPKSGRYHQLRRHMAWGCGSPLVGDRAYSSEVELKRQFRDFGLMLCSNKVSLQHPYYNSTVGRKEWDALDDKDPRKYANGMIRLSDDGKILVHAEIELPEKFQEMLDVAPTLNVLGE